ncbi:GNAT family N-acetyltransferase [Algoriphagus namhaensis]
MREIQGLKLRHDLNPGDLGQVASLHGRLYAEEHDLAIGFEAYVMECLIEFFSQYDKNKDRVWILENESRIVGFLALMHRPNHTAQLRFLLLEKEYRGKGISNTLMQDWLDYYHSKGYRGAYLYTTSGQDPAMSLYEKYGFVKQSTIHSKYFNVPLLEILFRLKN